MITNYLSIFTYLQTRPENDRHVTDNVKHEVKHAFVLPVNYGADLEDIMSQTGRSKSGDSD